MPYFYKYNRHGTEQLAKMWDDPRIDRLSKETLPPITRITEISQSDYDTLTLAQLNAKHFGE